MNKVKVISINNNVIKFDNGVSLFSEHDQNCCESHSLTMDDLTLHDFEGLEFNIADDSFFKKILDYGIELVPINGYSVKIPGHGYNNGYYGTNLTLVLEDPNNKYRKEYDITECQVIQGN